MNIGKEDYIDQVLSHLPREMDDRDEIEAEIRSSIEERLANGDPLWRVLDQLGKPLELAESYLQDRVMESASFGTRFIAKFIDLVIPVGLGVLLFVTAKRRFLSGLDSGSRTGASTILVFFFVPMLLMLIGALLYPALSEWHFERTLGKQILGLRVARESGARISLGQALLRQLPWLLQGLWIIDASFALFTEKKQRAAEMISHTRTILAP